MVQVRLSTCFLASYISYWVNYLSISVAYFSACNFLILIIIAITIYWALAYVPPTALGTLKYNFFLETTHFTDEKYEKHGEEIQTLVFFTGLFYSKGCTFPTVSLYQKDSLYWNIETPEGSNSPRHSESRMPISVGSRVDFFSDLPRKLSWKWPKGCSGKQTQLPVICVLKDKEPTGQGSKINKIETPRNLETLASFHSTSESKQRADSPTSQP